MVFGSGTKTGRVIADELFSPDPEKVKHQVQDPAAQARSHPVYENLLEQKEMFVQAIVVRLRKRRSFREPPIPPWPPKTTTPSSSGMKAAAAPQRMGKVPLASGPATQVGLPEVGRFSARTSP